MSINLVNIYRQLFSLKPPSYQKGNCLDIVNDIYMLGDDKILYDHLFLELEPKRCCIPYYQDQASLIMGKNAGTVEAILFYDKRFKAHYTTKNLYQLILSAFEYEIDSKPMLQIIVKEPTEVDSIFDYNKCMEDELCWDTLYKTESDLTPRGSIQFEEGDCSCLGIEESESLQDYNLITELDEFGYSVHLPEQERWDILRELVGKIGYEATVKNINWLIDVRSQMKTVDKNSIFKLEHDIKKLNRYY